MVEEAEAAALLAESIHLLLFLPGPQTGASTPSSTPGSAAMRTISTVDSNSPGLNISLEVVVSPYLIHSFKLTRSATVKASRIR